MLWTSSEAQEIDRLSSQVYGIPSLSLMEEAGLKIYHFALRQWKPYSHFVVLAGSGNNGGDALVVARYLHEAKFSVDCFDLSDGRETEERKHQRLELEKQGFMLKPFAKGAFQIYTKKDLVVIDGLLGIGLKGALRPGLVMDCLKAAAALKPKVVVAIDLPSGLDADAWQQDAPLLSATHTISFGELKAVHVAEPSSRHCGSVARVPLAFAEEAIVQVMAKRKIELMHSTKVPKLADLWTFLPKDAHKYDRGHVLAIGGSPGKVGAILMAAQAAMKAGAGWVSVAPMSEIFAPAWTREFTYESFALEGEIDTKALREFIVNRKVKALLIGCGTMETPLTRPVLITIVELQKELKLKVIFDAGALANIIPLAKGLRFDPQLTLLTPHPGEWKRLHRDEELQSPDQISDLEPAIAELGKAGFSAIYKSASPIVLTPGKSIFLSLGDNRLARAGSGDILAGLILGLAATPHSLHEIAAVAQNMLARASSLENHSLSPLQVLDKIL